MKIYDFILDNNLPKELKIFCEFSKRLKSKYKVFDGFGLDYSNKKINSIKLYQKFYTTNNLQEEKFLKWFCPDIELIKNQKQTYNTSIQGLNLAIKINLSSLQMKRAIYFSDSKTSSRVINFDNAGHTEFTYRYIYNPTIIRLLNFYFKFKMPKHREAIEFSRRGKSAHCAIFPKFNHRNMTLDKSKKYCAQIKKETNIELPTFIEAFEAEDSSFITQGYTNNNQFQKTYFGCFDWSKSIF